MLCIYMAEYASGWGLQRIAGVCPWNYSQSKYHINGLIRLDYAPVWFGVGLFFESIFTIFCIRALDNFPMSYSFQTNTKILRMTLHNVLQQGGNYAIE